MYKRQAQEGVGAKLPLGGTVLISVNRKDKEEVVEVAKAFADDGFKILATENKMCIRDSPNTKHFAVEACRFMTGKYSFMMAGLPGAAYAMYRCAKPEKRKIVGGLLFSAALTSFLTGITEPIEFTFLLDVYKRHE